MPAVRSVRTALAKQKPFSACQYDTIVMYNVCCQYAVRLVECVEYMLDTCISGAEFFDSNRTQRVDIPLPGSVCLKQQQCQAIVRPPFLPLEN